MKTQFSILKMAVPALALIAAFSACKRDESSSEETITRMDVQLSDGVSSNTFSWNDADGPGGNNPTVQTILVPANTPLTATLRLFDGNNEITNEVNSENLRHLFVFTPKSSLLAVTDLSLDAQGQPFGLQSTWTGLTASADSIRIVLYHEPTNKSNSANPGGEVDVDVTFPYQIQ